MAARHECSHLSPLISVTSDVVDVFGPSRYKIGDDLDIGISDGSSSVHSYWMNGIRSEKTGWDNRLSFVDSPPKSNEPGRTPPYRISFID
ncbi:hypothetical protein KIN20_003024 [Parelaphostrongylus tenuis]|uniref:MKRN2 opposite strand protein-like C-terminal domain-containing protein n=1 Tax=Parelaphostrongylus tenuis TaxID=148309 RepID=A0AAD5QI87_PARTN|nr:hypothetical protein KIN20_003024 [Parelaphostrongylus tenuis]